MKNILKILFMGTPDFALASLDSIYKSKHNLCCVVTSPDKKSGRGQILKHSPVKIYCNEKGINIIQPQNFEDEKFLKIIKSYNADIFVVVAFKILPKKVWEIPKLGTINIHASLLPNLRGAAPINWAIINGLKETGLTSFYIDNGIDTGNIISQIKTEINLNDDFGMLYKRLKKMSGNFILKTLENLNSRKVQKSENTLLKAPKLDKLNTRINWADSGKEIYFKIKGLCPKPGAWSLIEDSNKTIKIYDTIFFKGSNNYKNGEVIVQNKNKLMISVKDGMLEILSLQIEGKKKISGLDFINGIKNNKFKLI